MTSENPAAKATRKKREPDPVKAALAQLDPKQRGQMLELLLEDWVTQLPGNNPKRLRFLREELSTPIKRKEGAKKQSFRMPRLATVLGKLAEYVLSIADNSTATEDDLGAYALTGDPEISSALLKMSEEGEGVVIPRSDYNKLQAAYRELQQLKGEERERGIGKILEYIESILPEGKKVRLKDANLEGGHRSQAGKDINDVRIYAATRPQKSGRAES